MLILANLKEHFAIYSLFLFAKYRCFGLFGQPEATQRNPKCPYLTPRNDTQNSLSYIINRWRHFLPLSSWHESQMKKNKWAFLLCIHPKCSETRSILAPQLLIRLHKWVFLTPALDPLYSPPEWDNTLPLMSSGYVEILLLASVQYSAICIYSSLSALLPQGWGMGSVRKSKDHTSVSAEGWDDLPRGSLCQG